MVDLVTSDVEIIGFRMDCHHLVNNLSDDTKSVIMTRTNTLWHLWNIPEVGKLFVFQNIFQMSKSLNQWDDLKSEVFTKLNEIFHIL